MKLRNLSPALVCVTLTLAGCAEEQSVDLQPRDEPPGTRETVIQALSRAYRDRNVGLFQSLLANDPGRNADYLFFLSEPTELGEKWWGWAEEVRIHQRMFEPESSSPDDHPVDPDLRLQAVEINLLQYAQFVERHDLYSPGSDDTNCPGGKCADGKLDRRIWMVMEAQYSTDVFFQLAGEYDYQSEGIANFVVIEDLTKKVGDEGKFLLYFWEDLCRGPFPAGMAAVNPCWSDLKRLYR